MEKFKVKVSPESFYNGFGKINIELDNYAFPSEGWTDFGSGIVFVWAEKFTKLLTGEESKVKCAFMDGPLRFDVEIVDNKVWQVKCIREYSDNEECEHEAQVNPFEASEELLLAVEEMKSLRLKEGNEKAFKNYENRWRELSLAIKKANAN